MENEKLGLGMKDGSGYIKLFRSIRKWRYWPEKTGEKFSRTEAWIDLLMSANHADRMAGDVQVRRGQHLTSEVKLAKRWKWNRRTVRNFLQSMEKCTEIYTTKTNRFTMITICNYDSYQQTDQGPGVRGAQPSAQPGAHEQELRTHGEGIEKGKRVAESLADDVMEAYNRICKSFPNIRKINGAREQLISIASSDIDDWEAFWTTVENSGEWLKTRDWAVDFEWLLQHRLEILEGKYQDKKPLPKIDRSNDSVPR